MRPTFGPCPSSRLLALLLALLTAFYDVPLVVPQTSQTQTPAQAPRTSPQVQKTLPSYEGQNVSSVEFAGQPDVDPKKLEPLLVQRAGQPFSRAKVDESMAALQQQGGYHAVELEIRPDANGVRVLFVLQPAVYFGIFEFPGASNRFAYSRLLQIADYPPRGAFTTLDVQHAQEALVTFFKRDGYFEAEVQPEIQTDKQHGLANVFFHTKLNRHAKFGNVDIQGPTPEETQHLKDKLHSFMARLKASSIRPGKPYSLKTLQNATQYLENELMKQDHLGGEVKLIGANYDPATHRADIAFNVQPGPIVHVKVEGAHVWSWTKHKLLPVYQQNGLDPELIQEGRKNLVSYFQSKGFFDAKVSTDVQQQAGSETIAYQITKGPRHKVADVDIAGNQHLSETELKKHVAVEKAHLLTHGRYSENLVRTSVKNLERLYQANGFSTVKVTPQVTDKGAGNIDVTFRVNEGPQDIVDALDIVGNDTVQRSQLAPKGLKVTPGQPYSQKNVDEDRNAIMAHYLTMGYLTVTMRATARTVNGDKHRLQVTYEIYEGPRVETASVVTLGSKVTRQSLISRTDELEPGSPMREDSLLASESKLYNLGVFDWAEIDPRRTITTQTKEDALVKVHEAKRNQITYGFGFEVINRGGSVPGGTVALPGLPPVGLSKNFKTSEKTFWGPRGSFEYTRKNVRGKAETITIGGLAGRLDQRFSATYADPHFRSTDWASNLTISGEINEQNPIFSSRLADAGFQLQRALNPDKTQNLFLRYNLRETGLTRLLIPELIPPEDRHVRLSTVSSTYIRDTRDNTLDAHKGIYETAEFDLNPSVLGSNVNFAKLLTQAAYYKDIVKGIIWANSVRIGLEQPFNGSHVPISEKFFSGGGSTLRGFPLNGAGPQRAITACGKATVISTCAPITVPVGGDQLFILNSEFRIPINYDLPFVGKNLGLAVFYDGGNVYNTVGFHDFWNQYTNTVGLGLRYKTPVGPVRIDIGHNLNPLSGIKSTQIFVTLGQAF